MYTATLSNGPFIVRFGWHIIIVVELGVAEFNFANLDKIVVPAEGLVLLNSRDKFGSCNEEENASDYGNVRRMRTDVLWSLLKMQLFCGKLTETSSHQIDSIMM